mmetsp:Transcript_35133/g.53901  ORF Transcript_35133/g.53901 Transcript_35133/m.53901 type:complete len:102 (+) Transcript_35133:485-790(+)
MYCGKSAGAIIAGKTVQTALWKGWDDPMVVPGIEDPSDWVGVPGLQLVGDASFFPHMDEAYEELLEEKKKTIESPVVALTDQDAFAVKDGLVVDISKLNES